MKTHIYSNSHQPCCSSPRSVFVMKTGMIQQVRMWNFRTCFVTPVFITNTLLGKVQPGKKLNCPLKFICGHVGANLEQQVGCLYTTCIHLLLLNQHTAGSRHPF